MSDEVSDFLRSVEALKERREEEDEARSRELEEKILREKRERQARRAERARSISPQKSSPVNTPQSTSQRAHFAQPASEANPSSPVILSSSETYHPELAPSASASTMGGNMDYSNSSSPTKENDSPFDSDIKRTSVTLTSPSSGVPPSRSPLSWQRRPTSQASDRPKSRPLSMLAAENAAAKSSPGLPDAPSPAEQTFSRDQIAQSLAGRDPSWFRQTADRGQNSAAYRRSQVEDQDTSDMSAVRAQLPGMARDSTAADSDSPISTTGSRPGSRSGPPAVHGKLGSPLPLTSAQRLDPPMDDSAHETLQEPDAPASHDGHTSPSRPASPTKGMGGFVQSAMMKRSDSVKRWSVTSPTGLQRADTVTSNRSSFDISQRTNSVRPPSRPGSMLRDGSTTPTTSRPSSSAGIEVGNLPPPPEEASKPEAKEEEKITPPSSPSKTMDPRRWSPSKSSSWLDAALNKQESPKQKPAAPVSNQPAWMVELNKAKAQKASSGSVDLGRTPSAVSAARKHEVKTGGLMRSSPMGSAAKPAASVSAGFPKVPTGDKTPVANFRANLSKSTSKVPDKAEEGDSEVRRGSVGDISAAAKIKPDTPPKKDFRANLKPRTAHPAESGSSGQPEDLKNLLGSLRKTKTQNYVAPDTFKNNIMAGKSALNVTGGPKPSERKDEFKDAILQKKEEFKKAQQEGRSVTSRSASVSSEKAIPEGLAKKLELGRSRADSMPRRDSTLSNASSENTLKSPPLRSPPLKLSEGSNSISSMSKQDSTDLTAQKAPILSPKPAPTLEKTTPIQSPTTPLSASANSSAAPRVMGKVGGGGLAARFNPALAGLLSRGPPGAAFGASNDARTKGGSGAGGSSREPSEPGPQLSHMTKNRARGPRRKAPTSVAMASQGSAEPSAPAVTSSEPKSIPTAAAVPEPDAPKPTSRDEENTPIVSPKPQTISLVDSRKSITAERPQSIGDKISLIDSSKRLSEEPKPQDAVVSSNGSTVKTRPRSPTKVHEQVAALAAKSQQASQPAGTAVENAVPQLSPTIKTRPRSPTKVHEQVAALTAKSQQASKSADTTDETVVSPPSSPRKLNMKRMSRFLDQGEQAGPVPEPEKAKTPSPTKARPLPDFPVSRSAPSQEPERAKTPFPTKARPLPDFPASSKKVTEERPERTKTPSPTKERPLPDFPVSAKPPAVKEKVDSEPVVSVKNGAAMLGGSASGALPPAIEPLKLKSAAQNSPSEPEQPRSPPKGSRPLPIPPPVSTKAPAHIESPMRSPTKYGLEVSAMLTEFFGPERPKRNYQVDAAEVLMQRPSTGSKIQTQQVQVFQISGDGKKNPVAAHNERVLFEREMYLCPHTFINAAGKKAVEVYFWAGDEVPESSFEDAHIFAQKEARSFGGKLVPLRQGKETPEFIQALGGIILIRRGSSTKYDSLAPEMLCGRRFLGQFAFDEVDFSPSSLCSGFPYLITQSGQCYLWKGKGSDVEELGCARLIGMDLSLMGELVEIEEGDEPASFWNIFDGGAKSSSADHWKLKPNYDKYCSRLFWSNAAHKQQIVELSPFNQADLLPTNIYVLDAFFELYIIVGARSQHQYAAFRNALDFAQEYAILAAGMEDRPFVPISTVVLEGIPRDLKSVFRKWHDGSSPTVMNPNYPTTPNLKRGRSLRIVPLTQALQALTE